MTVERRPVRRLAGPLRWGLIAAGVYAVLSAINALVPEYRECVTDTTCLSSREDYWLLGLFQIGALAAIVLGARIGLAAALRMLSSPRRHWWMLLFFCALGALGLFAFFATVPRADWLEFIHIPIIGVLICALGALMFWGFRRQKRSKR